MNKQQQQIDEFFKQAGFHYWSPHETLASIMEELGEVARLLNVEFGPKNHKAEEAPETLEVEIGDVLFMLACLASSQNINLDEALQKSVNKITTRDKNRYNKE